MRKTRDNENVTRLVASLGASLVLAIGLAGSAFAQTSQTQQQTPPPDPKTPPAQRHATTGPGTPTTPQTPLPVNVDKIRTNLDRPRLNINDDHVRFYLEVHPPPVSFMSLVGNYDLMKGPAGGAALTMREMNQMMTPREMYSSAGITATDLLQFAATNYAAQTLIKRAVEEIRQAKDQKEVQEIRDRIDRQLAALMTGKEK
jgi:hypothetical protein